MQYLCMENIENLVSTEKTLGLAFNGNMPLQIDNFLGKLRSFPQVAVNEISNSISTAKCDD